MISDIKTTVTYNFLKLLYFYIYGSLPVCVFVWHRVQLGHWTPWEMELEMIMRQHVGVRN